MAATVASSIDGHRQRLSVVELVRTAVSTASTEDELKARTDALKELKRMVLGKDSDGAVDVFLAVAGSPAMSREEKKGALVVIAGMLRDAEPRPIDISFDSRQIRIRSMDAVVLSIIDIEGAKLKIHDILGRYSNHANDTALARALYDSANKLSNLRFLTKEKQEGMGKTGQLKRNAYYVMTDDGRRLLELIRESGVLNSMLDYGRHKASGYNPHQAQFWERLL